MKYSYTINSIFYWTRWTNMFTEKQINYFGLYKLLLCDLKDLFNNSIVFSTSGQVLHRAAAQPKGHQIHGGRGNRRGVHQQGVWSRGRRRQICVRHRKGHRSGRTQFGRCLLVHRRDHRCQRQSAALRSTGLFIYCLYITFIPILYLQQNVCLHSRNTWKTSNKTPASAQTSCACPLPTRTPTTTVPSSTACRHHTTPKIWNTLRFSPSRDGLCWRSRWTYVFDFLRYFFSTAIPFDPLWAGLLWL